MTVQLIKKIVTMIDEKSQTYPDVEIKYFMDSNMTLITEELFEIFDNIEINTTLTLKKDHNHLRSNSFEKVLENIKKYSKYFDGEKYKLIIRYNVHDGNINQISEFCRFIKNNSINCKIDFQNIYNDTSTKFKNKITDCEFENMFCDQIAKKVEDNLLYNSIVPIVGLSRRCFAYHKNNCKIYSDGTITHCDGFFKSSGNKELLKLPDKCVKCDDFMLCGGVKPCDIQECIGKYVYKDAVRKRIKYYVNKVINN